MNKKLSVIILCALVLSGCTQFWNKPGVNLQQTAKDLSDCRMQANQGGEKVFTPMQLEGPCMTAKGYSLSNSQPKP